MNDDGVSADRRPSHKGRTSQETDERDEVAQGRLATTPLIYSWRWTGLLAPCLFRCSSRFPRTESLGAGSSNEVGHTRSRWAFRCVESSEQLSVRRRTKEGLEAHHAQGMRWSEAWALDPGVCHSPAKQLDNLAVGCVGEALTLHYACNNGPRIPSTAPMTLGRNGLGRARARASCLHGAVRDSRRRVTASCQSPSKPRTENWGHGPHVD